MISILMIVYKVEAYLEQCIKSVLAQDYKDFELIIVAGDNKSDKCVSICKKYAAMDNRIKLIIAPPKGAPDARNKGMEVVTGDYLGFVDADDYIEPDMFSSMMKNIEETGADIAVCGRYYEFENKQLSDTPAPRQVYTADEALGVTLSHKGFFLHCWDKLYSRKVFEGLYFRTDVMVEDRIVVDTLISKADKIVYDPTPKYHFRERYGSMSQKSVTIRDNVIANNLMRDFIKENHPAVLDKCNTFLLYEHITAVQNQLVASDYSKEELKFLQGEVRKVYKECDKNSISNMLRVKAILALYFPKALKNYTSRRQSKVNNDLVRFP